MNKRGWAVTAVVIVGLAGTAAWWMRGRGLSAPLPDARAATGPGPENTPPLEFLAHEVVLPRRESMPQVLAFSGPLVAPSSAVVRSRLPGRLQALAVAEGDRVRRGQVLGSLDLADPSSRVAERAAQVDASRAALAQAERTHAQNERLAAEQFISPAALDSSRAAVQTARAQWQAAQASLDTSRVALRDGALLAPIAGIVARRHVLPGESVSADQPLLTLVDLVRLELAGQVATHEISRLRVGLPVQVSVEGHAEPIQGRLARLAPAAEPGTRAIGVTVELANADERLRAGQYGLARVTLADDQPRLTLPLSAVGTTGGQAHVWLLADGKLTRRAVSLGRRDEATSRVEVLEGLSPGARVLAARFDNLREGASARVLDPGTARTDARSVAAAPAASAPLR